MKTKHLFLLGLLGSFIVAGCNHNAEWNEALVDKALQNEKMSRRQNQREQRRDSDVIYLKQASVDDVNEFVVSCGKSNKASCVVICHVPPGNPAAQHTIVIGLSALHAHMNHGKSHRRSHDQISDYLGECRDLNELPPFEEEPAPTTTTTTLPPVPTTTTTSSTTTSTTTTLPPVPTTTTTSSTTTSTTTTLPPVPTTTTTSSTTTSTTMTLPPVPTPTTTTSTTSTTLPSGGECVPSDEIFVCP